MGTLSTIGALSDGSLRSDTQTAYRDSVAATVKNGFSLGSSSLSPGSVSLGSFETDPIGVVEENYPAWHGYYVSGLLQSIATSLDSIPDTGILSPVLFDPTKPVVVIIAKLKDLLGQLGDEAIAVLLSQINIVISKSEDITKAIENKSPGDFFSALSNTINEAYSAAGKSADSVMAILDSSRDTIEEKAREIMFIDADGNPIPVPEISIEVPSLEIPSLDISFMAEFNTSPLISTVEANGVDGIVTKFAKMMTAFLAIPSQISKAIHDVIVAGMEAASAAIQSLVDALNSILTNITEAVQKILDALLGFVWDIITSVIEIADVAFLEISSVLNIVIYFVKFFIISLIGFLLGSGLIAYSAAQFLAVL